MVNPNRTPKFLRHLILNRRGTAEVIGSVMFIIILMFAFSNIYLWHDNAVKTMNTQLSDKLNSQIEVSWQNNSDILVVTNTGGVSASLSRLWIVTSSDSSAMHLYADLEKVGGTGVHIDAGASIKIELIGGALPSESEIPNVVPSGTGARVPYTRTEANGETFTVLTTLGNMASPRGQIIIVDSGGGGSGGGDEAIGAIIIADYDTFVCNIYSNSNTYSSEGYHVTIPKSVIQSSNSEIEFKVTLKNNDANGRTINIDSSSQMFFLGSKNSGSSTVSYVRLPITNAITIGSGNEATVNFRANLSTFGFSSGDVNNGYTYALNLVLLGTIGSTSLGQNIPFVSISVTLTN